MRVIEYIIRNPDAKRAVKEISHEHRKELVDMWIEAASVPELSVVASTVNNLLIIDFIERLPLEISVMVLGYVISPCRPSFQRNGNLFRGSIHYGGSLWMPSY